MKRMRYAKAARKIVYGYRTTCWCCNNTVNIPDSGKCPICGATN